MTLKWYPWFINSWRYSKLDHPGIACVKNGQHWFRQWLGAVMNCHIIEWFGLVKWAVYDDVIKWKHFPRYWPFVRGIHRSPMTSPHKGQWRGALMFSLICVWINGWVNNHEAGDLRRHCAHYDVMANVAWLWLYFRWVIGGSMWHRHSRISGR